MILTKKNDLKEKQKEISVIYIYIYIHIILYVSNVIVTSLYMGVDRFLDCGISSRNEVSLV